MSGYLVWAIHETESGRDLGQGRRRFSDDEISVQKVESEKVTLQSLEIGLTPPFCISFARNLNQEPGGSVSGFGFSARRDDHLSFSWEWFSVQSPQRAKNLQEKGSLAIEIERGEIVRTEFLTDVSFRITEMVGVILQRPKWRITILEGSWMRWPPSWKLD